MTDLREPTIDDSYCPSYSLLHLSDGHPAADGAHVYGGDPGTG